MSDVTAAFEAFAAADVANWPGLPAGVRLADLAAVADVDPTDVRVGDAGDPPRTRGWVPVGTDRFAGGLRAWLDDDRVLALEGRQPLDTGGEFEPAPDLGPPDAALEAVLGPLVLPLGERVYAARGLALRVNPANGLLLGLIGFAPTTAEAYRTTVRPLPELTRPLESHASFAEHEEVRP